jgi:hypothetical protein
MSSSYAIISQSNLKTRQDSNVEYKSDYYEEIGDNEEEEEYVNNENRFVFRIIL